MLDGVVRARERAEAPAMTLDASGLATRGDRSGDRLQERLETARVRLLRLRERLEPIGDVREALGARGLRHARVHVRVLVRLAGGGGAEVLLRRADREIGRG